MAKPFLKWAGGKRQLISEIEKRLPSKINEIETYVEPFIGGGALLFHMLENYSFRQIHISDINLELVLCYRQLQSSVDDVISSDVNVPVTVKLAIVAPSTIPTSTLLLVIVVST